MWWNRKVIECLPISYAEMSKKCYEIIRLESLGELSQVEMVDAYHDYHRPYEITELSETYSYKVRIIIFFFSQYIKLITITL